MINDLQKTKERKDTVMIDLGNKSKGLRNAVQPRLAYRYSTRASINNTNETIASI